MIKMPLTPLSHRGLRSVTDISAEVERSRSRMEPKPSRVTSTSLSHRRVRKVCTDDERRLSGAEADTINYERIYVHIAMR